MGTIPDECWRDGYVLAYQAAVRGCRCTCKLADGVCRQLAEDAVAIAYEEQARRPFVDCRTFQDGWRFYASHRVVDKCRELKRQPADLADFGDRFEVAKPHTDGIDTVTLDEIPADVLVRFDGCVERLPEPAKSIVAVVRRTWTGRERGKIVQLDRYRDVLRLLRDDAVMRGRLQLEAVDFNNPSAPEYQKVRKILHATGLQLQRCIQAAPDAGHTPTGERV